MAKRWGKRAATPQAPNGDSFFATSELLLFTSGILIIFFLGFGTAAYAIRSTCWRLKTGWLYQEGQCRVVKADIGQREGVWIVDVEHRVEVGGRQYRRTTNTEEETPEAYTHEDAEKLLGRYEVGNLYPCWYKASDPDGYSVLLRDGLHPWEPLTRIWRSPVLAAPGIVMCWWSLRRARRRNSRLARA
jgi:hypothetical protein